jgi:hypothetical protein
MNAPLSHFLTRFADVGEAIAHPIIPIEARVSLTASDLEARLAAARDMERESAAQAHDLAMMALMTAQETERAQALATALADWETSQAAMLVGHLDSALAVLKESLSDTIAAVLRPLLAEAISDRARTALHDALDRILADPDQPCLTVRGPSGLLEAIRVARPAAAGLAFEVVETCDVVVTASTTHIETRLGAALAELARVES